MSQNDLFRPKQKVSYRGDTYVVADIYFDLGKNWNGSTDEEQKVLAKSAPLSYMLHDPMSLRTTRIEASDPLLRPAENLAPSGGQCIYKGGLERPYLTDDGEMYHVMTEGGSSYGMFDNLDDAERTAKRIGLDLQGTRVYILKPITYFIHQADKWIVLEEVSKELQPQTV